MRTLASRESADGFSWRAALEWKLEDCWVGAFWKRSELALTRAGRDGGLGGGVIDIWICLIPCLPIHLTFRRLS